MSDQQRAELLAELDAIADQLDQVADRLDVVEAERTELYARRTSVFQRARAMDPPITQRELAEHARVTDAAVIQVLRKAAKASNGAT